MDASTASDRRKDARRPNVSATTPVGISNSSVPTEKAAFAMNASEIERPASSKNRVLIPQMIEAARVSAEGRDLLAEYEAEVRLQVERKRDQLDDLRERGSS